MEIRYGEAWLVEYVRQEGSDNKEPIDVKHYIFDNKSDMIKKVSYLLTDQEADANDLSIHLLELSEDPEGETIEWKDIASELAHYSDSSQ